MAAIAIGDGSQRWVGAALTRELRREGWTVALVGRDRKRLRAAFARSALCIEADVSTPEGAAKRRWKVSAEAGPANGAGHCAVNDVVGATAPHRPRACTGSADGHLDMRVFHAGRVRSERSGRRGAGPAAVLVSCRGGADRGRQSRSHRRRKAGVEDWCARRGDYAPRASGSTRSRRASWTRRL